jgi:hypothetical protein
MHDLARETWGKDINQLGDLKFFVGHGDYIDKPDVVQLNVPDGKDSLIYKVKAILEWMLHYKYDMILKIDGDTYINVPEILKAGVPDADYAGAVVGQLGDIYAGTNLYSFIQGSASWLSNTAAKIVVDHIIPSYERLAPKALKYSGLVSPHPHSEDLWVGQALSQHILYQTIRAVEDKRYGDGPLTYHFARDKQTVDVFNYMRKLHAARPDLDKMRYIHDTERG